MCSIVARHIYHCWSFARSLGGKELVRRVPAALTWLSDPARILAHRGENDRYALTALGLAAARAVLPLDMTAGFAQLIRDLLTLAPSDQLLAAWRPLDHLIALELLFASRHHHRSTELLRLLSHRRRPGPDVRG